MQTQKPPKSENSAQLPHSFLKIASKSLDNLLESAAPGRIIFLLNVCIICNNDRIVNNVASDKQRYCVYYYKV